MKKILLIISTLLFLTNSTARASNLLLEAGLHIGGDKLATVNFLDGESQSMDAGGMISLAAGLKSEIVKGLELRTTIGIKFDNITASNGEVDFTRFPVNAMLVKKGEVFSIGIGATYHLNPEFKASGFTGGYTASYNNALGFIAEVDYALNEKAYLGLKATAIDYEINGIFTSTKINGNSIGVVIGVSF